MRIFLISSAIALFFLYAGAYSIQPGAQDYTSWADALATGANVKGDTPLFERDIGMPLILLLAGYPWTHSLVGVTIMQVLMGIAIPILAYLSIRPWFPRTAYYVAIVSSLSIAPFILSKTIHHDQPYIFFMMLSVFLTNRYVATCRSGYLYGISLSVFALSLIRLLGKGAYPFLLLFCLTSGEVRKNYRQFIASAVLYIACTTAYSHYRDVVLGDPPPIIGMQVFQNIYLNSANFGVRLQPSQGPYTKLLLDRAYAGLLPSPAKAPLLASWPGPPAFATEHFYKFTPTQLMGQIVTVPNFEYFYYLTGIVRDDHVLLMASWETARAHPFYVLEYTLRNSWEFLYDPGYLHGRFTIVPQFRGGLLFPFGGNTNSGPNVGAVLPEPALSEASFIPYTRLPQLLKKLYFIIEADWYQLYHPVTQILFVFMCVTWISTVVGVLGKVAAPFAALSRLLLSDAVIPASLGVSIMLLVNIGLTAFLVDSYYRYDYSLIVLKTVLAGIGCTVVLSILQRPFRALTNRIGNFAVSDVTENLDGIGLAWPTRHVIASWAILGILVAAGFLGWAWKLEIVDLKIPVSRTVSQITNPCLHTEEVTVRISAT
jgi:hypothetical protein